MRHLALALALAFAADIPFLTGRVVDDANIIGDEEQTRLTATLKAHEDASTNQVVVLTVTTIGGQSSRNTGTGVSSRGLAARTRITRVVVSGRPYDAIEVVRAGGVLPTALRAIIRTG